MHGLVSSEEIDNTKIGSEGISNTKIVMWGLFRAGYLVCWEYTMFNLMCLLFIQNKSFGGEKR